MFLGQYQHGFDDKGRLTIPAKFRELPETGVVVLQGLDHNLMVFPYPVFEKLYNHIVDMNLADPTARQLRYLMLGNALLTKPDGAGRILLSDNLKGYAGLKDQVVFIGQGDHFIIWDAEDWKGKQVLLSDPAVNEQRFATLQLTTK